MFGKKQDKLHHAAHIKGNTVGTSNEISFSVLDAARSAKEDPNQPTSAAKGFGKISLFTLPGSKKAIATPKKDQEIALSGTSMSASEPTAAPYKVSIGGLADSAEGSSVDVSRQTKKRAAKNNKSAPVQSSAEKEIARRKAKRRNRRVIAIVAGVFVVAALTVLGGYAYQSFFAQHQSAMSQVDQVLRKIQAADDAIVKMDRLLANPIDTGTLEGVDVLFKELDDAQVCLAEAEVIASNLLKGMEGSTEQETATHAQVAISARKKMLDSGKQLLEMASCASQAIALTKAAYDGVYVADSLARDAARLVSKDSSVERLIASREKTRAAIEELGIARQKLVDANELLPFEEVDAYVQYIDTRISALKHGVASDEALQVENTDLALQENDAYVEEDSRAAIMASQLPDDWTEPLYSAYGKRSASLVDDYESARTQAGTTDSFLRIYLGTSIK